MTTVMDLSGNLLSTQDSSFHLKNLLCRMTKDVSKKVTVFNNFALKVTILVPYMRHILLN